MFERYTEKARRVIFFARYEASEFGSPYIGAEFLLLGMLREDQNVVIRWLGEGDWRTIFREEIAKHLDLRPKSATSVDLPLTNEAKRILAYASEEAERLRHRHIGVEHLFLGILREKQSRAARMLFDRGIKIDVVRKAIEKEGIQPVLPGDAQLVGARHVPQVELVPEEGQTIELQWRARLPAAGEFITVHRDQGDPVLYQVVRVQWETSIQPMEPPFLSKARIHVREVFIGHQADTI